MKPISEKINYSLEETILENLFRKGIRQVYNEVQFKIHMDIRESLYTKVKQNTLI